MRTRGAACAVLLLGSLVLAGCGRGPATAPLAQAPTPATPASATASLTPTGQHIAIAISYPTLPTDEAVLMQALQRAGAQAKKEFLASLPDIKAHPALAQRQFQLLIKFAVVSRTDAFVSVRETGEADFGGAHPAPIDRSFVYAVKVGKLVGLDDLFAAPDQARTELAALARKMLEAKLLAKVPGGSSTSAVARKEWIGNMRAMIKHGTAPTAGNFSQFVVVADAGRHANGIELIFPPYQVAPYVYGTQTVLVLTATLRPLLKPAWRAAFTD